MTRRTWALLLVAGLLLLALLQSLLLQPITIDLPQRTRAPVATSPEPAKPPQPAKITPLPAPATLPPGDAPLGTIVPSLQARADAGDSRAACRLAAELIRCRQDAHFLAAIAAPDKPLSDRLARDGDLDAAISTDERALELALHQQQCEALPAGLLARAGDYLAQAARAGEPEAMILYLDGQHFPQEGFGLLGDPGLEAWRREAPAMAQALLHQGEPEAVFLLALAYGDDGSWFGGLIADDPVMNEAHTQLMRRLTGNRAHRTSPLRGAQLLEATERASDWHERYFDSRQLQKGELARRLNPLTHRRPDSSPPPCGP